MNVSVRMKVNHQPIDAPQPKANAGIIVFNTLTEPSRCQTCISVCLICSKLLQTYMIIEGTTDSKVMKECRYRPAVRGFVVEPDQSGGGQNAA